MPRRRPEFVPGEAGAEGLGAPENASFLGYAVAAKLKKFSAGVPEDASSLGWGAGGTHNSVADRRSPGVLKDASSLGMGAGRNRFLRLFVYNFALLLFEGM